MTGREICARRGRTVRKCKQGRPGRLSSLHRRGEPCSKAAKRWRKMRGSSPRMTSLFGCKHRSSWPGLTRPSAGVPHANCIKVSIPSLARTEGGIPHRAGPIVEGRKCHHRPARLSKMFANVNRGALNRLVLSLAKDEAAPVIEPLMLRQAQHEEIEISGRPGAKTRQNTHSIAASSQNSIPRWAFTFCSRKGCLIRVISVTRSAAEIKSSLALRPVTTTCSIVGRAASVATTSSSGR